jgi:HSP20 family protein
MANIRLRDPLASGLPSLRNLFQGFFDDDDMGLRPLLEEGSLAVDISEGKEGETIVRASLPGFRKEDVHVSVHNGVLDIKAESKEEKESGDERFYRRERRFGSVSRRIALPGSPNGKGVTAELADGVLTVKIPPTPEKVSHKIEVK